MVYLSPLSHGFPRLTMRHLPPRTASEANEQARVDSGVGITVVTGSPQNVVDYFVSSISVEYFESPPFREKWVVCGQVK